MDFKNVTEKLGSQGRQENYDAYVEDLMIRQQEGGTKVVEFREGPTKTRSSEELHCRLYIAPTAEKTIQCGSSSIGCLSNPRE